MCGDGRNILRDIGEATVAAACSLRACGVSGAVTLVASVPGCSTWEDLRASGGRIAVPITMRHADSASLLIYATALKDLNRFGIKEEEAS